MVHVDSVDPDRLITALPIAYVLHISDALTSSLQYIGNFIASLKNNHIFCNVRVEEAHKCRLVVG